MRHAYALAHLVALLLPLLPGCAAEEPAATTATVQASDDQELIAPTL